MAVVFSGVLFGSSMALAEIPEQGNVNASAEGIGNLVIPLRNGHVSGPIGNVPSGMKITGTRLGDKLYLSTPKGYLVINGDEIKPGVTANAKQLPSTISPQLRTMIGLQFLKQKYLLLKQQGQEKLTTMQPQLQQMQEKAGATYKQAKENMQPQWEAAKQKMQQMKQGLMPQLDTMRSKFQQMKAQMQQKMNDMQTSMQKMQTQMKEMQNKMQQKPSTTAAEKPVSNADKK